MQLDLVGRVGNISLPQRHALLPLFEAVSNSIHAIEDAGCEKASITIEIDRVPQASFLPDGDRTVPPITNIRIIDNGIGFTDENFRSFNFSDSTYKVGRGGKGIGRFLWLKAFDRVEVESVYEKNGTLCTRAFEFSLRTNGVNDKPYEGEEPQHPGTVVKLLNFRDEYASTPLSPKSLPLIGQRLLEHILEYFALDNAPEILLIDTYTQDSINLLHLYRDQVHRVEHRDFQVGRQNFHLTHFLLRASSLRDHKLNLCAANRVAQECRLDRQIPDLSVPLAVDEEEHRSVYAGYVSSPYLDQTVNPLRVGFDTPDAGGFQFDDAPSIEGIIDAATTYTREYLEPLLKPITSAKIDTIRQYILSDAPNYRHLLKHASDRLSAIPPEIANDLTKLDARLYEIKREVEIELNHQQAEIVEEMKTTPISEAGIEDQQNRLHRFLEKWNDFSKDELALYIVRRRLVLNLLYESLYQADTGRYPLEDVVHSLIFPLKTTSDDIDYESHNLWLLDERLSFHRFLASDRSLKSLPIADSTSLRRPDIVIGNPINVFDRAVAIVEGEMPYQSIVIFEFKRPMRDDYKPNDNPIEQVLNYIQEIRDGSARDKHGRMIPSTDTTRFYAYIVADITPSLHKEAEGRSFTMAPDGDGYFWFNAPLRAYFEILSYQKLAQDAERRNRVLFEKLNLPRYPM